MSSLATFATFDIKGVPVAAVSLPFACDFIASRASTACGEYVAVTGAHGIVELAYNERVREAHRQALIVVPDGMPLVWLGRLLGFGSMTRVYGPDLMNGIFETERRRRLKHFFYGANPSVILKLSETLRRRFGEFSLVGTYSPPMQLLGYEECEEVLARIRGVRPDLIWVALSTPKQELWMQMHMPKIGSGIAIGVGAAFDLLSGTTIQAPRWISALGLGVVVQARPGAEAALSAIFRRCTDLSAILCGGINQTSRIALAAELKANCRRLVVLGRMLLNLSAWDARHPLGPLAGCLSFSQRFLLAFRQQREQITQDATCASFNFDGNCHA